MTYLLQLSLVRFLEEHLADFHLAAPGEETLTTARVFCGALPPKQKDEKDNEVFPFVIVRWSGGDDEPGFAEDRFELILGVHGKGGSEDAESWSLALTGHLRTALARLENGVLENRFERVSVRASKAAPEKQQERYHLATISTTWRWSAPEQTLEA